MEAFEKTKKNESKRERMEEGRERHVGIRGKQTSGEKRDKGVKRIEIKEFRAKNKEKSYGKKEKNEQIKVTESKN